MSWGCVSYSLVPVLKEQDADIHMDVYIYMNSAGACTRVNIHIGALQLSVFQIHSLLNITPLGSDIILMSNINKIIDIRY